MSGLLTAIRTIPTWTTGTGTTIEDVWRNGDGVEKKAQPYACNLGAGLEVSYLIDLSLYLKSAGNICYRRISLRCIGIHARNYFHEDFTDEDFTEHYWIVAARGGSAP
jgi:hypothetical protein